MEVDPIRIAAKAMLVRAGRQRSLVEWHCGMHRTAREADASVNVGVQDVSCFLESLHERISIGLREGVDVAEMSALRDRWVADGGPQRHVKFLRMHAASIRRHLASVHPPFLQESIDDWNRDADWHDRRAAKLEEAYGVQEAAE